MAKKDDRGSYTLLHNANNPQQVKVIHAGEEVAEINEGLALVIYQTWYHMVSNGRILEAEAYLHGVVQGLTHVAMTEKLPEVEPWPKK